MNKELRKTTEEQVEQNTQNIDIQISLTDENTTRSKQNEIKIDNLNNEQTNINSKVETNSRQITSNVLAIKKNADDIAAIKPGVGATIEYVDQQDADTLAQSKAYTNSEIAKVTIGQAIFEDGTTAVQDVDIRKAADGTISVVAQMADGQHTTEFDSEGIHSENNITAPGEVRSNKHLWLAGTGGISYEEVFDDGTGAMVKESNGINKHIYENVEAAEDVSASSFTLNGDKINSWSDITPTVDLTDYYTKNEIDSNFAAKYAWESTGTGKVVADHRDDGIHFGEINGADSMVIKEDEVFVPVPIRGAGNPNDKTTLPNFIQVNQMISSALPTDKVNVLHDNTTLTTQTVQRDEFYKGTLLSTEAVIESSTDFNNMVTPGFLYDNKPDQDMYSFDILIGGEQLKTMLGTTDDLYAKKNITVNKLEVGKELEIPEINIPLFDTNDNIVANMTLKDIRFGVSNNGIISIAESVLMRWATRNSQGQESVKFDKTVFLNDTSTTYDKQDLRVYVTQVKSADLTGTSIDLSNYVEKKIETIDGHIGRIHNKSVFISKNVAQTGLSVYRPDDNPDTNNLLEANLLGQSDYLGNVQFFITTRDASHQSADYIPVEKNSITTKKYVDDRIQKGDGSEPGVLYLLD